MAHQQFPGGVPPGMRQHPGMPQQYQQQQQHPGFPPQHMAPPAQGQPMGYDQMNPQVTLMLVNVPPNVRTGEQMVVMTPTGQQYMVIVPAGAGPGSQFQIAVPRQDSMPPGYPQGMPQQHPGMQGMGMPGMMNPQQQAMMQQAAMQQAAARGGGQYGMPPGGAFGDRGRGVGGRGRGRKRKEKDLNRAPRQPSQYNLFMKTEVARIKQVRAHRAAHFSSAACPHTPSLVGEALSRSFSVRPSEPCACLAVCARLASAVSARPVPQGGFQGGGA